MEASEDCQKLLNVWVEGCTLALFLCDTRWRRNGCNAAAGALLSRESSLVYDYR